MHVFDGYIVQSNRKLISCICNLSSDVILKSPRLRVFEEDIKLTFIFISILANQFDGFSVRYQLIIIERLQFPLKKGNLHFQTFATVDDI